MEENRKPERLLLKVRVEVARELKTNIIILEHHQEITDGHLMVLLILQNFYKTPWAVMRTLMRATHDVLRAQLRLAKDKMIQDSHFAAHYAVICKALQSTTKDMLPDWIVPSDFLTEEHHDCGLMAMNIIRDYRQTSFTPAERLPRGIHNNQ